jgi:hypothetical protein
MRSKVVKILPFSPSFLPVVKYIACLSILVVAFIVVLPFPCRGIELRTDHATIIYNRRDQLSKFNERVSLRDSSYRLGNVIVRTVGDELRNKLDAIVEKAEIILNMFPETLKFNVMLLSEDSDVWASYKHRYGNPAHYIAFYSPQSNTIYISVEDVSLRILAHEIAHVIIDQYFCTYRSCVLVPVAVQEDLARLVEYRMGY